MFRHHKFRAAPCLVLGGSLVLAACASEPEAPTFGERLSTQGSEVSALGAQWTRGETLIAEGQALIEDGRDKVDAGERLVEKGEKRIRAGRREVDRGEDMVEKGKRLKREAEEEYTARTDTGAAGS